MTDHDDSFWKSQAPDDYLVNMQAMVAGLHAGLNHLLERMKGYHSLLELELEDNPAGRVYTEGSMSAVARAQSLIAMYGRVCEANVVFEPIELTVMLNSVATRLKKIDKAQLVVNIERDDNDRLFVRGTVELLHQLLLNVPLIVASDTPTTPVRLDVSVQTLDRDFFQTRRSTLATGEHVVLTWSCSDEAIDLDAMIALAEKQVSTPNYPLSERMVFTYGAVLRHHGDLFCHRDDVTPQSVTVILPLYRHESSMYAGEHVDESELRGSETILLVDDEGMIWDIVIEMLQSLGYTVILAENGKDCVEIYRENPGVVDLVLLDMVMPEMNGHEAFFALKAIDPAVKVLLSSGYVAEEDAREVLAGGAVGFLKKPYRLVDLAKKLRNCLG